MLDILRQNQQILTGRTFVKSVALKIKTRLARHFLPVTVCYYRRCCHVSRSGGGDCRHHHLHSQSKYLVGYSSHVDGFER